MDGETLDPLTYGLCGCRPKCGILCDSIILANRQEPGSWQSPRSSIDFAEVSRRRDAGQSFRGIARDLNVTAPNLIRIARRYGL